MMHGLHSINRLAALSKSGSSTWGSFQSLRVAVVMLIMMTLTSCNKTQKNYYPDGTLRSEIEMHGGQYHGIASFYYPSGSLQMTNTYRNGKLDGKTVRYFSNGQEKEMQYYKEDKPDSLFVSWDPSGNKLIECYYQDSLVHGPYTEYHDNGVLKIKGAYYQGLFDGSWLYYDRHGYIIGTGSFNRGTGYQKSFFEDGQLQQMVQYKNGLKEGEEKTFSLSGALIETKIYREGKLVEIK